MFNLKTQSPNSLYDIFIFTETWLMENIVTSELGFHGYEVFRYDENSQSSSLSRGGGVLISVRNTYISKPIVLYNINIELLFVIIQLPKRSLIISSVYIPYRSSINVINEYFVRKIHRF